MKAESSQNTEDLLSQGFALADQHFSQRSTISKTQKKKKSLTVLTTKKPKPSMKQRLSSSEQKALQAKKRSSSKKSAPRSQMSYYDYPRNVSQRQVLEIKAVYFSTNDNRLKVRALVESPRKGHVEKKLDIEVLNELNCSCMPFVKFF